MNTKHNNISACSQLSAITAMHVLKMSRNQQQEQYASFSHYLVMAAVLFSQFNLVCTLNYSRWTCTDHLGSLCETKSWPENYSWQQKPGDSWDDPNTRI